MSSRPPVAVPAPGTAAAPAGSAPDSAAVDEAFFALIAADPDLLRAEFDEVVDNAWGSPPDPPPPPRPGEPPGPGWSPRSPLSRHDLHGRSRHPRRTAVPEERSPPRPPG